jgi:hypothetical protein
MSSKNFPDLMRDWEGLLEACVDNAELLAGVEFARRPLVQVVKQVKVLKAMQAMTEDNRRETARHLAEACEAGREAARRLRGFVKFRLGTRSERLVQFGVAPLRSRRRRRSARPAASAGEAPSRATAATS